PPGAPWYGFARVTRHLADPGVVSGLKRSGCVMLKLGVESGDQDVLDALGKGIHIDTVSRALETIHQAGIATYVYLLFGTPAEDERSAAKTLDFTLGHASSIDFLNLAIFNLPAYGDAAGSLNTEDFYEGDLSLYREFIHPRGWRRERVRRFLSKAFKRPGAIRTILSNDPPFFTSNHAPFFGCDHWSEG
ncbi:MAG: radical SAM protein, partial [Desulfobacteraceae bacterium]|nr:radical SAM protein [Desulfobacteraceae bacterium]